MASGNFFGRAYVFRLPMVDGDHMGQQKNHIVIIFSTFLCAIASRRAKKSCCVRLEYTQSGSSIDFIGYVYCQEQMKLSIAVSLLVSASTAAAFQAPTKSAFSTTGRRVGRLNAVAIDPPTVPMVPTIKQEDSSRTRQKVEIDMTGIALSVRRRKNGLSSTGFFFFIG